MASLRDIFVRLGVKTDPKGFDDAERGITKVKESALTLGRVLTTGAIAIGLKTMIGVASNIEETANKFGAVFGTASDAVQQQLNEIGRRTGATNLSLQQMSSNIGALIKPSLGTAQAAGQMSASVAELALDISSFNDVTSEEALIALRSALIGSAEPMQRFGVDTRIAALQQEALRQGITTSYQKMTEGQRIALRYAAIQRQLGAQGATGDATQTAERFANASRHLVAALKETAGVIGTFLLQRVGAAVNSIRSVVNAFQSWLKANRALIQQGVDKFLDRAGRVIGAVVDLASELSDAFVEWRDSLDPIGQQILRITGIVLALVAAMMLPGVPILLLAALIGLLVEDFQTWRAGGESVIGDIVGFFKWLGTEIATWASDTLGVVTGTWDDIVATIQRAIQGLVAAFMGYANAVADTVQTLNDWVDEHRAGISVVTSMAAAAAGLYAAHWARANALAIEWFLRWHARAIAAMVRTRVFAVKSALISSAAWVKSAVITSLAWLKALPVLIPAFLSMGTSAVATAALMAAAWVASAASTAAAWVASAATTAAAWFMATAPLVLTVALLTVIIGTVIFLARELYRLATGQENFFTTMADGIAGLIEDWGGIGPAIGAMLDEALRFWLDFFGATDEQIDTWIEAATDTLQDFWKNVLDFWTQKVKAFFGWVGGLIPDFGFGDNEEGGREAVTNAVDRQRNVMGRSAAAMPGGSIMGGPTSRIAATPGVAAAGQSIVRNENQTVNITVNPSAGMDEAALAEMTAAEIQRQREVELRQAAQSYALEGAT